MPNTQYSSCMTGAMRSFPKGISREERGLLFCANAKVCAGKQPNIDAAKKFCQENPTAPKVGGHGKRGIDSGGIAACLLPRLTGTISIKELTGWISECSGKSAGVRIRKPESKSHFVKVCALQLMTEQGLKGTFAESVRMQKICNEKWKEKEAGATAGGVNE